MPRTSTSSRKHRIALPKPSIRRIAMRGGSRRLKADVYEAFRKALMQEYLLKVVNDAALYATQSRRKTVLARDVANALAAQGRGGF